MTYLERLPNPITPPFETLDPVGLKRLLDALDRREEQEAVREARRVMALARAVNGGATFEEVLADLVGPERAREIVQASALAQRKAQQRAYEG